MMAWSASASASQRVSGNQGPTPVDDVTAAGSSVQREIDTERVITKLASADPKTLLDALGALLAGVFWNPGAQQKHIATRDITPPGEQARNRHDLVGVVTRSDKDENAIPIWVTCAEATNQVIDVVLSVYLRKSLFDLIGFN